MRPDYSGYDGYAAPDQPPLVWEPQFRSPALDPYGAAPMWRFVGAVYGTAAALGIAAVLIVRRIVR